jgi:hypothetical protein
MRNIPFTLIPLILFNIVAFLVYGPLPEAGTATTELYGWERTLVSLPLFSGQSWHLTAGDLLIVVALFCLFGEVLGATNLANRAIGNHLVSILVLIVYVIEFVVVERAAQSVFFILTIIALIDVLAGIVITIRLASRDIAFERAAPPG